MALMVNENSLREREAVIATFEAELAQIVQQLEACKLTDEKRE